MPEQDHPHGFNREADDAHRKAAEAVDGADEEQPRHDEGPAKGGEAQGCAVPVTAGVEERDKGGQHAVTHAAQSQAHAMRGHLAQHMAEGKMFAPRYVDRTLAVGQCQADCADEYSDHADGTQAPLRIPPQPFEDHA